jgi:tetratricopeptide (TPR) repeat protein
LAELPYRLAGRALLKQGRLDEATSMLEHALRLTPSWESYYLLGVVALQQKRYDPAIALLDRAVESAPGQVAPLYQLSLAFGLSQHLGPARAAATRAAALDPGYPGLVEWMRTLGMRGP